MLLKCAMTFRRRRGGTQQSGMDGPVRVQAISNRCYSTPSRSAYRHPSLSAHYNIVLFMLYCPLMWPPQVVVDEAKIVLHITFYHRFLVDGKFATTSRFSRCNRKQSHRKNYNKNQRGVVFWKIDWRIKIGR